MAAQSDNPFEGASPDAFHLDAYDNLLGLEVAVEDLDHSVPAFNGEQAEFFHRPPIANMIGSQGQTSKTADDTSPTGVTIKEEPLDWDSTPRIPTNTICDPIELSDTEDLNPDYRYHAKMLDDTFSISESEKDDNDLVLQADESVPIKKEDDEVEFVWEKMDDHVIDLDTDDEPTIITVPDLGKSILKGLDPKRMRPHMDRSAILKAQEFYLRDIRSKRGIPEPSGPRRTLNGLGLQPPKRPELPVEEEDESAWMKAQYTPDEDNGQSFRALKKAYNSKVRTDSNTMTDDIEFTKAEKGEKLRKARLQAEYETARGYSDDDDSDGGLFMSPTSPTPAKSSRSKPSTIDDPDVEANPDPRGVKQRKPNGNSLLSQSAPDQELEMNMMVGIEALKKLSHKGEKSGKKGKGKRVSNQGGQKKTKRRRNKVGSLVDANSLLTSNVYEDADENLGREALLASSHSNKDKALAALVASVPLGTTQKDATSEKNRILKATQTLGRYIKGHCKADVTDDQNTWKLPGLKSSLRHHQVLGAAFCVERETGGEEPLGGMLADAMGLGKTVMMLALMTANPPPRGEKNRATLIVCTPGLLKQWEREIEKHTEAGHLDAVLKHHSVNRVSGKAAIPVMEQQDIILTTYQEVVKSYPRLEIPEDIRGEDELKAWWEKQWNQERDVLHQARFYRVVLDESQVIKNHKSQTSVACRALMAKHKWACSATPIMNNLEELYPYFKFLRVPYTGSFSEFQGRYCEPGSDDCNSRLHCLLDQIMCRRTMKDTILGAPILKLPKHSQRTINIEFSPVEKALYRRVLKKFVGIVNKASADGTLEKHPGLGLVAFLRLRQMCAHTFLVQEVLEELLDLESLDNMKEALIQGASPENKNDRDLLTALKRMIEARPEVVEDAEEPEDEPLQPGGLAAKLGSLLKTLKANSNWSKLSACTHCQICGEPPESAMVMSCLHVYCQECLEGLANKASAQDRDATACEKCGVVFTGAEPCGHLKDLEWDDKLLIGGVTGRKKGPKKIDMRWVYYENKLVMSTKITAVRTQVEKWLEEEPDKKIIIFSQFHMIMQIVEKVCQKQKWKYCTYNGKMTHQAREKTITDFAKDGDTKIMVASLKCGGIGLNLTMASKVICIDLWFNNCVEQQAFCRVFRMGQISETFITRFIVNSSADGKLQDMQLRKSALISQAMDDRSVMSKLTTEDILRLFGEVRLDKNKRPFVHLEDDEKLDSLFEKRGEK